MEDGKILDNEWKSQVPGGHCFDDYLAPTLAGFESGTLGIPSIHLTTRPLRTLATMTPNGDEENKDDNSNNNDKVMTKPTTTTEEGERRQSCRDNRGGGHHRPQSPNIMS